MHLKNRRTKMSYPVGHFNCKLDAKGRLMIPSEFKEQMGEQVEEGFVLRPGLHATCLELYTRKDWDEVQAQLRASFAGARFVKLDATGRLQIPKDLIEKGALVKDVIITSVTTKMEIWDKERYDQSINELDDEEFFNLLSENIK